MKLTRFIDSFDEANPIASIELLRDVILQMRIEPEDEATALANFELLTMPELNQIIEAFEELSKNESRRSEEKSGETSQAP